MHPYLTRLGVSSEVQGFFAPYYSADANDLLFQQGNYREHFGFAFHRVEADSGWWIAGDANIANKLYVSHSVMDIIAYLHFHGHKIPDWNSVLFIAMGMKPEAAKLRRISDDSFGKPLTLLFPADVPGAIMDLKIAAAFLRMPAAAFLAEKERLHICFRSKIYEFDQQGFSLSVFERAAKYRFNVTTRKPKHGASFLEQLKAGAFPSL